MWYLQKKTYIMGADNARYTLTADGVDFVELQRSNIPVLNRLLTSGMEPAVAAPKTAGESTGAPRNPIIVPHPAAPRVERRVSTKDRRASSPDSRGK
jgi:hypothetical protein